MFELPSHRARFVPAGSKLVFQMHYTPTGSPQQDITKLGFIFADPAEVREEMITLAAINHEFEIPPGASEFPVKASKSNFPPGATLHAIAPHMHVRGRSFRVEAVNASAPDNREVLLDVPHYDFTWQHAYALREPIPLPDGLRLECTALFDNSEKNLVNPDPSITVRWGDQTWQEMMIGFFDVAIPVDPANRAQGRGGKKLLTDAQKVRANRAADDLIARFDRDGDGIVQRSETPDGFAAFGFKRFDANKDKTITREEARAAAVQSQLDRADRAGP
jgi:hypothetical protein